MVLTKHKLVYMDEYEDLIEHYAFNFRVKGLDKMFPEGFFGEHVAATVFPVCTRLFINGDNDWGPNICPAHYDYKP